MLTTNKNFDKYFNPDTQQHQHCSVNNFLWKNKIPVFRILPLSAPQQKKTNTSSRENLQVQPGNLEHIQVLRAKFYWAPLNFSLRQCSPRRIEQT